MQLVSRPTGRSLRGIACLGIIGGVDILPVGGNCSLAAPPHAAHPPAGSSAPTPGAGSPRRGACAGQLAPCHRRVPVSNASPSFPTWSAQASRFVCDFGRRYSLAREPYRSTQVTSVCRRSQSGAIEARILRRVTHGLGDAFEPGQGAHRPKNMRGITALPTASLEHALWRARSKIASKRQRSA